MYKYQKQLRVFPREFSLQIERCRTILVSRVTVCLVTRVIVIFCFFFLLTDITHVAALTTWIRLRHICETLYKLNSLIFATVFRDQLILFSQLRGMYVKTQNRSLYRLNANFVILFECEL